jgi:hypothetical protein
MQVSCFKGEPPIGPTPLLTVKKVSTGIIPLYFRERDLEWSYQELDTNAKVDIIHLSFKKAISNAQFSTAISIIQNEVYEYSKILAKVFDKNIEDRAYISDLICTLTQEKSISEEQSNRLFVLLMVLDGLDMEVNECGATVDESQFVYLQEFLQVIDSIIREHNVQVGISDTMAEGRILRQEFYDAEAENVREERRVDVDEFFDPAYGWTSTNMFV